MQAVKVFLSYSHADEAVVERLRKHMSLLRRDGLVAEFYDRKIPAGGEIDETIFREIDSSQVFIAVVSADYLSSGYCYDRELSRAFELHEKGDIEIVPIIAEACDWKNSPLAKLKAVPKDGREISLWENKDVAFLNVVSELRSLIQTRASSPEADQQSTSPTNSAANRYKTKRKFDEVDRISFRENGFLQIREFFETSIREIGQIEGVKAVFRRMDDFSFTCTILNSAFGRGAAHITVHMGTKGGMGDVFWSFQERALDNVANGWARIEHTEYRQYFRLDEFRSPRDREKNDYSAQELARVIWDSLIEKAGIDYA